MLDIWGGGKKGWYNMVDFFETGGVIPGVILETFDKRSKQMIFSKCALVLEVAVLTLYCSRCAEPE